MPYAAGGCQPVGKSPTNRIVQELLFFVSIEGVRVSIPARRHRVHSLEVSDIKVSLAVLSLLTDVIAHSPFT